MATIKFQMNNSPFLLSCFPSFSITINIVLTNMQKRCGFSKKAIKF